MCLSRVPVCMRANTCLTYYAVQCYHEYGQICTCILIHSVQLDCQRYYSIGLCSEEIGKNCETFHSKIMFTSVSRLSQPLRRWHDIQILMAIVWHDGQKSRCAIDVFRWMRCQCTQLYTIWLFVNWQRFCAWWCDGGGGASFYRLADKKWQTP